ncbi:MAG TPA: hypothetical protein VNY84_07800 [Acidimicrobiales bacterium]|nr:hypothetical protein [Acidimicrobiales bacterium]
MTEDHLIELVAGPARLQIAPDAGGRLAGLNVAGLELLVTERESTGDPLQWGAFPMAPWAGRVRRGRFSFDGSAYQLERTMPPNAIHGTTWYSEWHAERDGEAACRLTCDLEWPFGGRAVQLVELEANAINLTLEVEAGPAPMPAACGWHPWWRRDLTAGGTLELEFEAGKRWERGPDYLPTGDLVPVGERPLEGWDDCFTEVGAPPVLRWPGAVEVTVESDCRHLVIYDRPSHALCVEPQTAPPDAFNNQTAARVEPGRPLVAHTRWSWVLG